ncbi:uncharacterized protein LOC143047247 [Mytilus galloprovincialis]|uniref:uncharacterized protein LOC143047247 n=1 Tax=Mytilus galloprovincialis TaxID=29158 RepID=UPI003003BE9A
MDVQPVDIDPNFEPQTRVRSNTWPCRPREVIADAQCSPVSDESVSGDPHKPENNGLKTKSSSRRNAWGNLSYADLITKAIQNSPEQRLTLSQIYDWMVQNVPYFKDKGDSTSSAGWKNSIRHNLSLHSRFMRIQNEGTGKSSWWVLNPDAKPGKTPRRRAGSMETKSYEKRRGRVKKKVEAVRAAMENIMNGSPSGDDFLSDSPLGFQLSPEFRPRASSNASSCGRLSPIQAAHEPDLHDSQVPPMSPIPWGSEFDSIDDTIGQYDDQLVDTLVGSMKLCESTKIGLGSDNNIGNVEQNDIEMSFDGTVPLTQLLSNSSDRINLTNVPLSQFNQSANRDTAQYRNLPAPPAYPGDSMRRSPLQQQPSLEQLGLQNGGSFDLGLQRQNSGNLGMNYGGQQNSMFTQQDYNQIPRMNSQLSQQLSQLNVNTQQQMQSPARSPQQSHQQISPNYGNQRSYGSPQQQSPQNKQISNQLQNQAQQQQQAGERSLLQRCLEAPSDSLLRAALTQKNTQGFINMSDNLPNTSMYNNTGYENRQIMSPGLQLNNNGLNNNLINMPLQPNRVGMMNTSAGNMQISQQQMPVQQTMQVQKPNSSNSLNEIEADFFEPQGFDMEQMLQHELSLEGNLDFNFDPTSNNTDTSQNLVR